MKNVRQRLSSPGVGAVGFEREWFGYGHCACLRSVVDLT